MKSEFRSHTYTLSRVLVAFFWVMVTGFGFDSVAGQDHKQELVQKISNTQIAALDKAMFQIREHKNEISALTRLMRDQFFDMENAKICEKLVAADGTKITSSSAKIVHLRTLMEPELRELQDLVELVVKAVAMFPGIENKAMLPYHYDIRELIDAGHNFQLENMLREVAPLFRLAVDAEDAPNLTKNFQLEFPRSGRKLILRPGDHVTVSFTNTNKTGKGYVRQSQPHWHDQFVILSAESTQENENGFFGVGLSYIRSVTIRHLDGTIEIVESGEPTDAELREAAKSADDLQKLRLRLRPRSYPKTLESTGGN